MNFYALDLETQSLDPAHEEYALQPWRIMEGKMVIQITCVTCEDSNIPIMKNSPHKSLGLLTNQLDWLRNLSGKYVWTWAGAFDIACLIASGIDCSKILWLDAMSAAKRVFRSQHTDHPSGAHPVAWSLANISKNLLKDWDHYDEFMDVKKEFSFDLTYLQRRCQLDTEATLLLGELLWKRLTEQQQRVFLIESESLYLAALAWMRGAKYNFDRVNELEAEIVKERQTILYELMQIHTGYLEDFSEPFIVKNYEYPSWEKYIGSNDQLAILMYDNWGVPFDEDLRNPKAKTDKRPVNKGVLTFLIERYGEKFPQLALIRRYRELKSKEDKFLKGPKKTRAYLGSDIMRHRCKINSTCTGRTAYVSKG